MFAIALAGIIALTTFFTLGTVGTLSNRFANGVRSIPNGISPSRSNTIPSGPHCGDGAKAEESAKKH